MTQKQAIEILKSGKNVFLTGQPGAGKTYTINEFVESIPGKRVAITATTGIAATHIGGVTIHSWSGIGDFLHDLEMGREIKDDAIYEVANRPWIRNKIAYCDVLIIDEVSMLGGDVFELVDRICREARGLRDTPFGGLQVVLVGDFFQLPPVTKEKNADPKFVFNCDLWNDLKFSICSLHEQHRQDDQKFLEILTAMRNGVITRDHVDVLRGRMVLPEGPITQLFTHNGDVDNLNVDELKKLPGEQKGFLMESSGKAPVVAILKRNCLSPEKLYLKVGALVMFTRNNFDEGYVNGSLGVVIEFEKDTNYPIVRLNDGRRITVEYAEWSVKENREIIARISQIPLRLAWAITVHKSQGMSLDSARIDLGKAFEYGQGYVALSRVRSLKGLYLDGLNEKALQMHPIVVAKEKEFNI